MKITLTFLGAAQTVTGSKYLVTVGDSKYLIDCGLFQGLKYLRLKNWKPFDFDPASIKAVLLTHAHIDHSGAIPLLIQKGFSGSIYSTQATRDLCEVLLPDSGYLQEEDARLANSGHYSKHKPALPLYTEEQGRAALGSFKVEPYKSRIQLDSQIYFTFFQAGHILGASQILLEAYGKRILFSGDLGRNIDPVMRPPLPPVACDSLIVESTYGDRSHSIEDPKATLKEIINQTLPRGGTLLIPSFAVGRAQTILFLIHQLKEQGQIPDYPVYLNSPMAINAQRIFEANCDVHKLTEKMCHLVSNGVKLVRTQAESMALQENSEPKIILSASGMATGGRVLHHLKTLLPDKKNSILFAGFQAAGTRGEAMIHGAEKVKIHGQYYPVKASVYYMDGLSAHADADELVKWISLSKGLPQNIFITHGEPQSSEGLRKRLSDQLGIEAYVPQMGESIIL